MNTSPSITNEAFETFLKKTGLDMEAVKVPTPNTLTGELESGYYSIHNKKTGEMIHSGVSDIFEVVQHSEALSVIQDIAAQRDIRLASGGIWNGGSQAYAQISLGSFYVGNRSNGDKIEKRITFINSHDGSMNFHMAISGYRLHCKNQLPTMMGILATEKKKGKFTSLQFKHTKGSRRRIMNLSNALKAVDDQFEYTKGIYNKMEGIKVIDKDAVSEVIARLFPMSESDRQRTLSINSIEKIMSRLTDGDGGRTKSNTAWGLFQAIQGTYQHDPIRRTSNHEKSVLVGNIAEKSAQALTTILEVCSSQSVGILHPNDEISRILSGIEEGQSE